jgi:hypothetical protein
MCEPPIDARRAERKHQCAGTGRHHHARRKHKQTQHAARRQHACVLHVCATGAVASCAAGQVCVGPNPIWPGSLGRRQATWERRFESSRRSSIPAAAQRRQLGEGGRP